MAKRSNSRKKRIAFSIGIAGALEPMIQRALRAEELGCDSIWAADHLSDIPPASSIYDAWPVLAYVGARTENAALASGVTDIQRSHPAKTASSVATLDHLTGGRAVLGIGAGEVMNTKPYGMEWEDANTRIARLREYIEVIQLLWMSSFENQVGYKGKFYRFKEAHLSLLPFRKPRPPIYIGAFSSESMLKLAGELADGWFPGAFFTTKTYTEKARIVRDAASRVGRNPSAFDFMVNLPVVFGNDHETMSIVRASLKRNLVVNRYMLRILGEEEAYKFVSENVLYQTIAPTPRYAKLLERTIRDLPISDDALDKGIDEMMAIGSVSEVTEKASRFIKAGATHIHLSSIVDSEGTLDTFAKKVMPALRN